MIKQKQRKTPKQHDPAAPVQSDEDEEGHA